jgi:hypothetical protein
MRGDTSLLRETGYIWGKTVGSATAGRQLITPRTLGVKLG